jgi:hypothetical protein
MRRYSITYAIVLGVVAVVAFVLAAVRAFGLFEWAPDPLGLIAVGLAAAVLAQLVP